MQIPTYVIYNPLPVPMCNGILDIDGFTRPCSGRVYLSFFLKQKPDLIHIHTFMGLHREFLNEAQRLQIPVVFTSHDYFGVCPRAIMMFDEHICDDTEWKKCGLCSKNAYPKKRLLIEHSGFYRFYRSNGWLVEIFHKGILKKSFQTARAPEMKQEQLVSGKETIGGSYSKLKRYYADMFQAVTHFHFNSALAEKLYRTRLNGIKGSVIPISHSEIKDCRRKRRYGKTLRLGYFGSLVSHKGFFDLLNVCKALAAEGCADIRLHIYSDAGFDAGAEKFVVIHPNFDAHQLQETMKEIDVLVVPSKCPETFGLVVLEALSFGVPVIVSDYVGAKDLLLQNPGVGFLYDGTQKELERALREIYDDRGILEQANASILKMTYDFSYERHAKEMLGMYRTLLIHTQ